MNSTDKGSNILPTVATVASWVGAHVVGDASRRIEGLADLAEAGPHQLSFWVHRAYAQRFYQTRAGAVLVDRPIDGAPCTLIVCEDPYLALAHIAHALHPEPRPEAGQDPHAHRDPDSHVHPSASLGPGSVIEAHACIGPGTYVGPGCVVGRHASIGAECHLHAGAKVLARCRLGHRVILHAGVVVGSDGFGFAIDKRSGQPHKIPQLGRVDIEDDVEIGANSTIDRATFGVTRIGAGTKIDNLVQIAHNVVVGRRCVVASQTGIAGSTTVGDRVIVGAQAGMVGHLHVADGVTLGARSAVTHSIRSPGIYSGVPLKPHKQWLQVITAQQCVPDLRRRVRQLEARLAALEALRTLP